MRIAIDGSHGVFSGGIRTYLEHLVPAMRRVEPDSEIAVLLRGRTADRSSELIWAPRTVPVPYPRRLLDLLEHRFGRPRVESFAGTVDVVHGTHFSLPRARPGVPTVLTVHDIAYLVRPDLYDDPRGNDYGYGTLLRRSLERADRIIAISHHTKRDLVETLSVDPERIWVVPFGVDPRIATTDARARWEAPRRVGIEGTYAIYPIGTLTPRKNIERTLRAFARAFPDPPDRPVLLLTGPETLPARERSLIEELGLEASVRVARVADGDALAALLAGARWGLYTSLYEGFGLPPLEAMAAGLPMLVSDRTALPEVVGEAAALVDPENEAAMAEAMRRLHVDPSLRETLQDRGRRRALAPAFSWERVARQTLAVYRGDRAAFDAEVDPLAREVSPSRAEEEWTR